MESELIKLGERNEHPLTDDRVDQMLMLAERLREANGGVLDEATIQAVAEATGAPLEYVRLAVKVRAEKETSHSFLGSLRAQFLTLDPTTRRFVISGAIATGGALLLAIERAVGPSLSNYNVLTMIAMVFLVAGLYNAAVAREARLAAITGAILGGGGFVMYALFSLVLRTPVFIPAPLLIPAVLIGTFAGLFSHRAMSNNRAKLGLKDPVKERQAMLTQLVELQERLRSGEQSMTFLSVDIVGSTRLKQLADPLSVEFTFTEYHSYVERITKRYGGQVHSTAGDGVTCAFDHPQQAFGAARTIQTGLIELNTHRNKIGTPIVLRCGVHTGTVVTPDVRDVTSVNFSQVIDIAAHMQKVCPPGGVVVSDAAATFLPGGWIAVGTEKVATDDMKGTVWTPRAATATKRSPDSIPPPAPAANPAA